MKNMFGNNEDGEFIKKMRDGFIELIKESSNFEMIEANSKDPLKIDQYALSSPATGYYGYMNTSIDTAWEIYYTAMRIIHEKDYS